MTDEMIQLLIGSGVVALIAAAVACLIIVYRYKKKLKAPIYPTDKYAKLSLSDSRDNYIGTTVTRVRVASSRKKD